LDEVRRKLSQEHAQRSQQTAELQRKLRAQDEQLKLEYAVMEEERERLLVR